MQLGIDFLLFVPIFTSELNDKVMRYINAKEFFTYLFIAFNLSLILLLLLTI